MSGFPGSLQACRRSPGVLRYGPLSGSPQHDGDLPIRMAAAPSPRTAMTEARRVPVFNFQIEQHRVQECRRSASSSRRLISYYKHLGCEVPSGDILSTLMRRMDCISSAQDRPKSQIDPLSWRVPTSSSGNGMLPVLLGRSFHQEKRSRLEVDRHWIDIFFRSMP